MKRVFTLLISMFLCLCLTSCSKASESVQSSKENHIIYSNQEDVSVLDKDSIYFVDCQGTNDIYSSMSITKNGNDYLVVMDIYRLGSFSGTASEMQGIFFYTDDYLGITGIIQLDQNQASFEVIESSWDLVTVGDVWEFQEMEDSLYK